MRRSYCTFCTTVRSLSQISNRLRARSQFPSQTQYLDRQLIQRIFITTFMSFLSTVARLKMDFIEFSDRSPDPQINKFEVT
ncbi:hypothetical protein QT972_05125 [Microcoleus sp. herbarium7]|uniref:hypothetical protein n=1 Tax=Microcoleus sp. herbarium13 TaxID=3055438 RepID=UPI002FD3F668